MPTLILRTNVSREKFPADFIAKMTAILMETLGKPEKYISVVVEPGLWMSFGGTEDPCASVVLGSIGALGGKRNVEHSKKIMGYLSEILGIQQDRMYITFQDSSREDMGHKGTTFAEL